jgi:hypothetical protein
MPLRSVRSLTSHQGPIALYSSVGPGATEHLFITATRPSGPSGNLCERRSWALREAELTVTGDEHLKTSSSGYD